MHIYIRIQVCIVYDKSIYSASDIYLLAKFRCYATGITPGPYRRLHRLCSRTVAEDRRRWTVTQKLALKKSNVHDLNYFVFFLTEILVQSPIGKDAKKDENERDPNQVMFKVIRNWQGDGNYLLVLDNVFSSKDPIDEVSFMYCLTSHTRWGGILGV